MINYIELGKKIYKIEKPREFRRYLNFLARCFLHRSKMKKLEEFFDSSEILQKIAEVCPFVYEQPTRAFFYRHSTFDERIELIKNHMKFVTDVINEQNLIDIYARKPKPLWESKDGGDELSLRLVFYPGQRKEGLLSIVIEHPKGALYKLMFWIAPNKNAEWSLWIGAMQGPHMENAKEIVKQTTKRCHAYRTKNLILHSIQEIASGLGLAHIYAVTNYGYYAMNHIRADRKLKTDFGDFWEEAGGEICEDRRFYELPLTENRKKMEEIPASKRATYRRRYALIDEIDESIANELKKICKQK